MLCLYEMNHSAVFSFPKFSTLKLLVEVNLATIIRTATGSNYTIILFSLDQEISIRDPIHGLASYFIQIHQDCSDGMHSYSRLYYGHMSTKDTIGT
jgi:hypothetical protein